MINLLIARGMTSFFEPLVELKCAFIRLVKRDDAGVVIIRLHDIRGECDALIKIDGIELNALLIWSMIN